MRLRIYFLLGDENRRLWCIEIAISRDHTREITDTVRLSRERDPSPGRAAKRKKMKIRGTYLLQGPFGRNKTNLPTYLGGASQCKQSPYHTPIREEPEPQVSI